MRGQTFILRICILYLYLRQCCRSLTTVLFVTNSDVWQPCRTDLRSDQFAVAWPNSDELTSEAVSSQTPTI